MARLVWPTPASKIFSPKDRYVGQGVSEFFSVRGALEQLPETPHCFRAPQFLHGKRISPSAGAPDVNNAFRLSPVLRSPHLDSLRHFDTTLFKHPEFITVYM
jgi:hypothetical protein